MSEGRHRKPPAHSLSLCLGSDGESWIKIFFSDLSVPKPFVPEGDLDIVDAIL